MTAICCMSFANIGFPFMPIGPLFPLFMKMIHCYRRLLLFLLLTCTPDSITMLHSLGNMCLWPSWAPRLIPYLVVFTLQPWSSRCMIFIVAVPFNSVNNSIYIKINKRIDKFDIMDITNSTYRLILSYKVHVIGFA